MDIGIRVEVEERIDPVTGEADLSWRHAQAGDNAGEVLIAGHRRVGIDRMHVDAVSVGAVEIGDEVRKACNESVRSGPALEPVEGPPIGGKIRDECVVCDGDVTAALERVVALAAKQVVEAAAALERIVAGTSHKRV